MSMGEVKLALTSSKQLFNYSSLFLSLYNNSFISLLLNLLFQPRSQGSLQPTSTERGRERETLLGAGHECPRAN